MNGEMCKCEKPLTRERTFNEHVVLWCDRCWSRQTLRIQPRERANLAARGFVWHNDHFPLRCCCFSCVMRRTSVGAHR